MKQCHVCWNNYDKCFDITINESIYSFDYFECAIYKLTLACNHCGCKIIGHGVEQAGTIYCYAHCAKMEGITSFKDRI